MEHLLVGPFVRATHPQGVAIWTEWSHSGAITLTVTPTDFEQEHVSSSSHTVTVAGRYYALSQITGLQPSTWYNYRVSTSSTQESEPSNPVVQCFRTLDLPDAANTLRLAYGSCRRLSTPNPDALSAFGSWLLNSMEQRESLWPHLLLLIGDQIYADDHVDRHPPTRFQAQPGPDSQPVATQAFEDFACLYTEAWVDPGIRQVFAVLPIYMIFDDHEITNSWNTASTWRMFALQHGFERTLVDGLVAYWIYQGWGNSGLQNPDTDDLLAIMQQATQNGQDILEALRVRIRQAVYQEKSLHWHYTIPTRPPLFVADVRSDRPAILDGTDPATVVLRIMSQDQLLDLHAWMQEHTTTTTLLVSSVPAILPPLIGFAEYVMGVRPFHTVSFGPLRRLGHMLAGIQRKIALRMSFDHWPVFGATWNELVALLTKRKHDIVILSGDVHFSYSMSARRTLFPTKKHPHLYQLVASPFKNTLVQRDKRLVLMQSWLKHVIYGGLHMHVLRLTKKEKPVPHDILFQNVIALVTFRPQAENEGQYTIQQTYLGIEDQSLEEVGSMHI